MRSRVSAVVAGIACFEKARTQPIAGRIIEVPEDEEQSEVVRNPRSGFRPYWQPLRLSPSSRT